MRPLFFIAALLVLLTPESFAQASSLVPCTGLDCSSCHLVEMGNNIVRWLVLILFVVFAVIMTIAGFGLVTSGGNQAALEAAKTKFKNALIGIIVVMAAWLIVDTLLKALLTGGEVAIGTAPGPWYRVQCVSMTVPEGDDLTPAQRAASPTMTATSTPADCQPATLMSTYGGSNPGTDYSGMAALIACYRADPLVNSLLDTSQIYTYERSEPRCALTNGRPVPACGINRCAHSVGSCHYGRGTGNGAMAVDFNAIGNRESELYNALQARQGACGGRVLYERSHTHISHPSCP